MVLSFANRGLAAAWRGARSKAGTVVALLCWCLFPTDPLPAHEGHDLASNQENPAAASLPRLSALSELYELVGVLDGLRLTIYLDRFKDNVPVTDANIERDDQRQDRDRGTIAGRHLQVGIGTVQRRRLV